MAIRIGLPVLWLTLFWGSTHHLCSCPSVTGLHLTLTSFFSCSYSGYLSLVLTFYGSSLPHSFTVPCTYSDYTYTCLFSTLSFYGYWLPTLDILHFPDLVAALHLSQSRLPKHTTQIHTAFFPFPLSVFYSSWLHLTVTVPRTYSPCILVFLLFTVTGQTCLLSFIHLFYGSFIQPRKTLHSVHYFSSTTHHIIQRFTCYITSDLYNSLVSTSCLSSLSFYNSCYSSWTSSHISHYMTCRYE
jgi:hypothetical protein